MAVLRVIMGVNLYTGANPCKDVNLYMKPFTTGMATQMQLKVLFGRKSHGRQDFSKEKTTTSLVFFGVNFYVYTNVDNRERARASYSKQRRRIS